MLHLLGQQKRGNMLVVRALLQLKTCRKERSRTIFTAKLVCSIGPKGYGHIGRCECAWCGGKQPLWRGLNTESISFQSEN